MALPARVALRHNITHTALPVRSNRVLQLFAHSAAASAAPYVSQEVTSIPAVPVPLCQRDASHVESVLSLMRWREDTLDAIKHIKDAFESADGGPASSELQRELTWALDDAIAAVREHEQQQWLATTWQQLESEYQTASRRQKDTSQWQVQLRAPVQQLQQLWHLRLQERVPFQYLIHTAHWRDLILSVGPGILVPRPETELMIDLAAAAIAANPALAAAPWADLGTGSGAIAIGTAKLLQQQLLLQQEQQKPEQQKEQQQPTVFAVDLSPTAVAYTSVNAERCGVQSAVRVLQGSWFEPLQDLKRQLGGILSNPPYIPRVQMDGLQAEVGRHEPWSALDGGPESGLDSLQVICEGAAEMLMPGGFIALETAGGDQAFLVQQLLQEQECQGLRAFDDVTVRNDCYGVPRFVSATRRSEQQ